MMKLFLTAIDFLMPLMMVYWVLTKRSLAVVYIPFVFFAYSMLEESKIIIVYQAIFAAMLLYLAFFNLPFLKRNVFYLIILLILSYNMVFISDPKTMRWAVIGFYWTLTIVPLAPQICKAYTRKEIFDELGNAGFLILFLFIVNSGLATVLRYYPENHYGFTSGVSFGHLDISEYSILPLAVYLCFRKGLLEKKLLFSAVAVASIFLTMLTLRRTVMAMSLIAILVVLVELLNFKQLRQFAMYAFILGILALVVVQATGFSDQLLERIEKRDIQDKDLESELRYLEFGLVYKDLFVYYDYDPWFGFGPLDSWGNYGKGVFGDRPLHSDITYYVHGFGIIGIMMIFAMYFIEFFKAWKGCFSRGDFLMLGFVVFYFLTFFLIGSPKTPMSPVLLFMMLGCLFGRREVQIVSEEKHILA